ncbi:MAG: protein kinase [Planctomycetes bacterium]|nr:protein kinase [Planctomycetota bacterium]
MPILNPGDRINNYLLEKQVGAGSFGEVWRARHHVFGDIVAIKIPTDTQYVRNLQREGVAIHGLKHPNVVRAIDLDPYGDPPYLIMEFVDGPSLREAIDQYGRKFPVDAAIAIACGVLCALKVSHENGLIHRDVKPANILLAHPIEKLASIESEAVKVTDFGLGRVGGDTAQTIMQSGSMLTEEGRSVAGTLAYMAPEQKAGLDLDGRCDLYACGIMLFEMLVGERPQGTDMPSSFRRDVPGFLDEAYRGAYTRLERRFASAEMMLKALEFETAGPSPSPPPPSPGWRPPGAAPRCSKCAKALHRDDQFCIHCGHQQVASVPRCASCHEVVHASDRFCIFCGNDLRVMKT